MSIYIARVYADLIEKQQKTLEDVPENLKTEVQQILDDQKDG